jgi:hypothetical protein
MHVLLEPVGDAPEVIPVYATISALRPSRNTKGFEEVSSGSKAAAEIAKIGLPLLPSLGATLMAGVNILPSQAQNKKTKNWFLYQFWDGEARCPVVEWNINRQVFQEYGPLLRGTLYLAFHGSTKLHSGQIRLRLRPQIRYHERAELEFIIPTDQLPKDEQVFLEIRPRETAEAGQPSATTAGSKGRGA